MKIKLTEDRNNVLWIDLLKSLSIVLVVYYHVVIKHVLRNFELSDKKIKSDLHFTIDLFDDFRMPVFFAISGYLARKYLESSWKNIIKKRILKYYYLYVIWLLILTFIHNILTPNFSTVIPREIAQIPSFLIYKPSNMWYLYALALYFIVARSFHKVWILNFLIGISLTLLGDLLVPRKVGHLLSVIENFIWFIVGAYFVRWFLNNTSKKLFQTYALLTFTYVANQLLKLDSLEIKLSTQLDRFLIILFSILITNSLLTALNKKSLQQPFLARYTLEIYILHFPILGIYQRLLTDSDVRLEFTSSYFAVLYAILLTIALILGSIKLGKLIKLHFPFLLDLPASHNSIIQFKNFRR